MKKKFLDKQGLAEFCKSFKDKFVSKNELSSYAKKDEIKDLVGDVKPDLSEYAKKSETLDKEKNRFDWLAFSNRYLQTDNLYTPEWQSTYTTPYAVVYLAQKLLQEKNMFSVWDETRKKVDKVNGKQLSSNDYTNEDKQKLIEMPKLVFLEKEQYESLSEKEKMDNTKLYYTYVERQ